MKHIKTERAAYLEALHDYGIDDPNRVIFVDVERDEMIDSVMAQIFVKNLHALEDSGDDPITIKLITCGGEWAYGMAIYDAIAGCPCHVKTVSYAWARSMSSIIPQAADERVITPNSRFMIHFGSDGYEGTHQGIKSFATEAEILADKMLEIYTMKCINGPFFKEKNWAPRKIKSWLKSRMEQNEDWYMSPQEAVNYGFMDRVGVR